MLNPDRRASSVPEPPDSKTEVLSESTNLDSLLVAILGEERQEGDDRAQLVATIDAQVAEVVQELGLDKVLAERRRRESEGAAGSADAEPARATADSESVSTDSSSTSSNANKLRLTLGRLFPTRTSTWLVVILVGGAALVTVSAINERGRPQETPVAAKSPRTDVVLPVSAVDAATSTPPVSYATARPAGGSAVPNPPVASVRRLEPRSVPARSDFAAARRQAAWSTDASLASKRADVTPLVSAASVLEPSAAQPVVHQSQPALEASAAIVPAMERSPDAEATRPAAVPEIVSETPKASPVASPTPVAGTRSINVRRPARPLERSEPVYPALLRSARVVGTVDVAFTIDKTGRPTNVQARSGPPPLRAVAVAAIQQWRYEPATLNDVAVESEMTVQFTFGRPNTPRPE